MVNPMQNKRCKKQGKLWKPDDLSLFKHLDFKIRGWTATCCTTFTFWIPNNAFKINFLKSELLPEQLGVQFMQAHSWDRCLGKNVESSTVFRTHLWIVSNTTAFKVNWQVTKFSSSKCLWWALNGYNQGRSKKGLVHRMVHRTTLKWKMKYDPKLINIRITLISSKTYWFSYTVNAIICTTLNFI